MLQTVFISNRAGNKFMSNHTLVEVNNWIYGTRLPSTTAATDSIHLKQGR